MLSELGWSCEIWLCVLSSEIAGAITEIDESEDVVNFKCEDAWGWCSMAAILDSRGRRYA